MSRWDAERPGQGVKLKNRLKKCLKRCRERWIYSPLDFLFLRLLRWFCERRLDQWERWKLNTKYGPVYIDISRKSDGYDYVKLKD